jgi:hypothetical protein
MNSGAVMDFFVGVENQLLETGDAAFRCGRTLGGSEGALPNAGPRCGVATASPGGRRLRIAWASEVAWRKQVELSGR